MRPKVSIIVPIYNMEDVLKRCIDSLIGQTLRDIEIVAVNDGSIDASLSILQQYDDERLIIIDQANSGVSSARNVGIQAATGAFIGFVDPDDWIELDMFEVLYETAFVEDADIVMCSYVREFGSHSKVKQFNMPDKMNVVSAELQLNMLRRLIGPLKEEIAQPELLDAWGTVWCKLYRAELMMENDVRFVDLSVIGSNEDTLFNIHMFYYASSFVFINRALYHYWRANEASITSRHNPSLLHQFLTLYGHIEQFLQEHKLSDEYYEALSNRICFNALGLGLNIIYAGKWGSMGSMLSQLKAIKLMLNNEVMRRSFKQFEWRYCPFHWKVFFICAKLRMSLGLYAMLNMIEWLRKNKRIGG